MSLALRAAFAVAFATSISACSGSGATNDRPTDSSLASIAITPPKADGLAPGKDYVAVEVWSSTPGKADWKLNKSFSNITDENTQKDSKFSLPPGSYTFDLRLLNAKGEIVAAASSSDSRCPYVTKTLVAGPNGSIDIILCAGAKPADQANASVAFAPKIVGATPSSNRSRIEVSVLNRSYDAQTIEGQVEVKNIGAEDLNCTGGFSAIITVNDDAKLQFTQPEKFIIKAYERKVFRGAFVKPDSVANYKAGSLLYAATCENNTFNTASVYLYRPGEL